VTLPPPSLAPPGWYPDPAWPARLRYWNGTVWTDGLAQAAPKPRAPHPTLPIAVAFGALVSMGVPLVLSRVILRQLAKQHWPIAGYVVIAGLLAYGPPMLFWRYASRRWGSGRARADVGLSVRWSDTGWGPVTWVSCFIAEVLVAVLVTAFHIPFKGNTESVRQLHTDHAYIVTMLILAVVAAPIVEEIVFRGMVLRGLLDKLPAAAAVIAQAVLFGAAHFDPSRGTGNIGLIMALSAVGGVLGGATYLFRRLGPNMIAHAILNGVVMAIVLSGWHPGSTN
jgi:membrane protease YdiL (CAAX protease family)